MPHTKPTFWALLLTCTAALPTFAQDKRLVSGSVTDATTGEPLPFATVALKKQLIGIVTNETGKFDLYVPADQEQDTLVIGFFGYRAQRMALSTVTGPLQVKLVPNAMELQEVVVRPLPPEAYIRMAMRRIKENYPATPFGTEAYYREKVLENKNLIKCDEGVFKTYYLNYLDTTKNQHQLQLFRRAENTSEVAFMKEEREKKAEKEKKTGKKDSSGVAIDLTSSFGGPENSLRSANINRNSEACLDTTRQRSYRYSFAKSTTYNDRELMVIDFESRGKVDHQREAGKIYIDVGSFAIVKLESSGSIVIPAYIRPILFLYGIGIENPKYDKSLEFQLVNGKWYPKNIQYNVDVELINRHWFRADEHSLFEIESVFTVNKTKLESLAPIAAAKRFDSKKDMKTQVYNDDGLTWEGLNIIKK